MADKDIPVRLFEDILRKYNPYLKFIGIFINMDNESQKKVKRFKMYYYFNIHWALIETVSEVAYLINAWSKGEDFLNVTFVVPCMLICIVSLVQSLYFTRRMHVVEDLLKRTKTQLSSISEQGMFEDKLFVLKKSIKTCDILTRVITIFGRGGLTFFGLSPIFRLIKQYIYKEPFYYTTPYLVLYPFDIQVFGNWVIAYTHVMWSAIIVVLSFASPYFVCYICTAAVSSLFEFLSQDVNRFVLNLHVDRPELVNEDIDQFIEIVKRHKDLMSIVDQLEEIFSLANLLNVIVGSVTVCLTAFNVTIIDDYTLLIPFVQFLGFCLGQVVMICYHGEQIKRSSMKLSEKLFESRWMFADRRIVKNIFIMFMRSQKPSKFTAYGFVEINLLTCSAILSKSTSYFALVRTLYTK